MTRVTRSGRKTASPPPTIAGRTRGAAARAQGDHADVGGTRTQKAPAVQQQIANARAARPDLAQHPWANGGQLRSGRNRDDRASGINAQQTPAVQQVAHAPEFSPPPPSSPRDAQMPAGNGTIPALGIHTEQSPYVQQIANASAALSDLPLAPPQTAKAQKRTVSKMKAGTFLARRRCAHKGCKEGR